MPIIKITRQGLSAIALSVALLWGCVIGQRVAARRAFSERAKVLRDISRMQRRAANATGFSAGAVPPSSLARGGGISSTIATMAKLVALLPIVLFAAGCSRTPSDQLARLSDEFVHTTLAFSPAMATAWACTSTKARISDNLLDDMSPANLDRQRHYYEHFRERLDALNTNRLTGEDQADLSILQDQVSLALLDLNELHSHLHNPLFMWRRWGTRCSAHMFWSMRPRRRACATLLRGCRRPFFLDQASTNLTSSPGIWTKVAMEENEGNIGLVDKTSGRRAAGSARHLQPGCAVGAGRHAQVSRTI